MTSVRRLMFNLGMLILSVLPMIVTPLQAGMPSPLPTNWTSDNTPSWAESATTGAADVRWQAISFFIACLLLCSVGVQFLWNTLRRDVAWLPRLSFGRAVSFVTLWGLLFVIVLTMISGARELMTPGAWRKQGWTYQLVSQPTTSDQSDNLAARRAALERLRLALFQHAAKHAGQFPEVNDSAVDQKLWEIPGWAGLKFLSVSEREADDSGRLLVFEPELDDEERLVLLTNGVIGSMRTAEVKQALVASGR